MNSKYLIPILVGGLVLAAHAGTTPKFSVVPVGNVSLALPHNGIEAAVYRVTNNTRITRALTFESVNGVIQNTTGPGVCSSPFTLAKGQSCFLTLIASEANADSSYSNSGPVVCKTSSATNTTPNPFLCSQPGNGQQLQISVQRQAGTVFCWGDNFYGQIGRAENFGTEIANPAIGPTAFTASNIVQLSTSYKNTCAVDVNGGVTCWGDNTNQQLGANGPQRPITSTYEPVVMVGLAGPVKAVQQGDGHLCALLRSGAVQCWGNNVRGQTSNPNLGSGEITNVPLSETALKISVGGFNSCALLQSRTVACWGSNASGELGPNQPLGVNSPTPVIISGLTGIVDVKVGGDYVCALNKSGQIFCWGSNEYGQLGNTVGNNVRMGNNPVPTQVSAAALGGVPVAINTGDRHTCALLFDRSVTCWGDNTFGELGNGASNTTANPTPTAVVGLAGPVTQIVASDDSTCALLSDGRAQCWGFNEFGQLGNSINSGTLNPNPSPLFVENLNNGLRLSQTGGGESMCVLR